MHRLLARQLKKHFGNINLKNGSFLYGSSNNDEAIEIDFTSFIESIDQAYQEFDDDRALLEHSSDLSSNELKESLARVREMKEQMLIQDKMASLGALSAGIAHEIKNPLNFVNNFASLSKELLEELSDIQPTLNSKINSEFSDLINLLNENLDKVVYHGERADNIVRGMLLHSRGKSGEKQSTNLNSLLDEFLKLSYHGMRAKDGAFNIDIITQYSESLPLLNIVPQDISRVFVNLFNNSFYATMKKASIPDFNHFKPFIRVATKIDGAFAVVEVEDNGIGIPADIKPNIFNPFFTTKAPNEGTGLGLSITYEIIVDGHRGSISFNSEESKGTCFKIKLPLENN